MSGNLNKYADLPDIDSAPDIYETEDIFPATQPTKAESSDDEAGPARTSNRTRNDAVEREEELDLGGLISPEEASRKFRKAERRNRLRTVYAYPPSPESLSSPVDISGAPRPVPLSHRLRVLQAELSALEHELADPANPLLRKEHEEENVDPGELIRGLVDVRGRLDKIRKGKEGRGRLIGVVLEKDKQDSESSSEEDSSSSEEEPRDAKLSETRSLVEIDKRVGELEKLVGSSSASLDETSPLPPPLLPLITRLNSQLALLTQPRHLDSISRRLKLLLSDLERASASQQHRRHSSQTNDSQAPPIPEHLIPILSRLGPSLPQIPHVLTRLRTLSVLHTSASEFQSSLESLEKEHQKVHITLTELNDAVETVEKSLEENRAVVKNNVAGLEARVESLLQRLEELSGDHS